MDGDLSQHHLQAYNTNLIRKDDLPSHDLVRPEWKGKLGIEAEDFDWFAQVVTEMGEAPGSSEAAALRLFREIVSENGISVRKGHSLLTNLVAAGEVPLALTVYGFLAEQAKLKGAPLDWFVLPPAVARATAQGLARNAPHPNAAVLFFDFLLGEGQQILASRQFVTVSRKIDTPFDRSQFKSSIRNDARPGPQVAGHLSAHDHRPVAVMVTAGNKSSHADRVIALLAPISLLHCRLLPVRLQHGFCTRQFRISAT